MIVTKRGYQADIFIAVPENAANKETMLKIEQVFEELKEAGVVRSGVDFSQDWLGMEASYFRGLRAKRRSASVKVLANCAVRLRRRAALLGQWGNDGVHNRGDRYALLADQCVAELLAVSEGADNAQQ